MSFAVFTRVPLQAWADADAEALLQFDPGTFHVRQSAMAALAYAMEFVHALDEAVAMPEFPEWPPANLAIDEARADALMDHFSDHAGIRPAATDIEREAWLAYDAARDQAVAVRSPDSERVPAFKFASNDGWFVTAPEAVLIARKLDACIGSEDELECLLDAMDLGEPDGDAFAELLERWARFNRIAAAQGGYTLS